MVTVVITNGLNFSFVTFILLLCKLLAHQGKLHFILLTFLFQLGQTSCNFVFIVVSNGVNHLPVGIFGSRARVKLEENYTHGCTEWIVGKVSLKSSSHVT